MQFLADALTTDADLTTNPESKQARTLIEERLRGPQRVNEIVIVESNGATVDDAQFQAYVEDLYADVIALGPEVVAGGTNFFESGDETLVSNDRTITILPFSMAGTAQDASDNIDQVLNVLEETEGNGFAVSIAGNASMGKQFEEQAEKDLQTGEMFGIPIALIILALVFGALLASVIPIVLAIVSIVVAIGVSAVLGQQWELSFFVTNVVTMIGLAVGIDYSLFVISRYREERSRGLEKVDAIAKTGATASRTVFFSGMTVVIALLGMLIVPQTIFRSIAGGSVLVALAAVAASLTLLPAVLSLLGDKVNWGRIPFVHKAQTTYDEEAPGGFWDRIARTVIRHPVLSFGLSAALLVAASIPYFSIETGFSGISTFPDSLPAKQAFLTLDREFTGGMVAPAQVVVDGDIESPAVQQAIAELEAAVAADPDFGPSTIETNEAGDLALLEIPVVGDPNTALAEDAVERLRDVYVPQAFAGVDAEPLVGGFTAENLDGFEMLSFYTPVVFAFVLGLSFILLLVVFRSIVVPIKAVIMNLLSVGAAYGLLVLVTQKGFATDLLGFQQVEKIEAWLPIFLFAILFGLSMDYHVFLLSRIRERYDQIRDNDESIVFGLRSTGRLITGAALIMVAVFAGFATGQMVMFQQMGFGAAIAVLIDATIVRSVLVPASMKLLGDWNWYLPSWLEWLPKFSVEGAAGEAPARMEPAPVAGGSE
jgi:RND superfamily putative drug exporter